MSILKKLKAEQDIMSLCESFSAEYKSGLKQTTEAIEQDKSVPSDDEFNMDDIYDTVDVGEDTSPEAPSFAPEDIELSQEEKEEIKAALVSVLDKIEGRESISEPALEMIVNEVANDATYLSEAEDANLEGPVEKEGYRISKIEAAKAFINELLGVTVDNGGQVPENVENLGGAEGAEGAGLEGSEELPPPVDDAGVEGDLGAEGSEEAPVEDEKPLQEGSEAFSGGLSDQGQEEKDGQVEDAAEGPDSPVTEGTCMECGEDDAVEVDPSETIRILDDNDPGVSPIEDVLPGEMSVSEEIPGEGIELGLGEEGEISDETPLTVGVLKELFGKMLAEGVEGDKSFAELWKNLAGNGVTLSKPTHKGFQKSNTPSGNATLKDEAGNEVTLNKVNPKGFQKTKAPEAGPAGKIEKGATGDQGLSASTSGVKKQPVADDERKNIAAVIHEASDSKKTISFLKEAAEAVKKARNTLQS